MAKWLLRASPLIIAALPVSALPATSEAINSTAYAVADVAVPTSSFLPTPINTNIPVSVATPKAVSSMPIGKGSMPSNKSSLLTISQAAQTHTDTNP